MLDSRVVSLSLAITMVMAYLVCAFFVYLFPTGTLLFFNTWFHGIDLTKIASSRPMAFIDFIIGFISTFLVSYLTGAIFTVIYNTSYRRFYGKGD